jgi:hypothetical protein
MREPDRGIRPPIPEVGDCCSLEDMQGLRAEDWTRAEWVALDRLLCMPAALRLRFNLAKFMSLLAQREVRSVLQDGLDEVEYSVLYKAQSMDVGVRRAVHTLLNIPERDAFLRGWQRSFRVYRTRWHKEE